MKFETRAIHTGTDTVRTGCSTVPSINQNVSYHYESPEEFQEVFAGCRPGYVYSRIANPTVTAFEQRMTALEEGLGAIATSSGMAAITTVILTLAENNGEVLASKSLFGGTYLLFNEVLRQCGITVRYVDVKNVEEVKTSVSERTACLFIESISNPKLEVADVLSLSNIMTSFNIPIVIDNTVSTPYLWKAKEFGADIIVHSATKYITGNATAVGGVLVDTGKFNWSTNKSGKIKEAYEKYGPFAFLSVARSKVYQNIGVAASPMNAFFHLLGLETLGLRMERHCSNAVGLALYLSTHPKVKKINYAGLKDHPSYPFVIKQFNGKASGLLTFELGSKDDCFKVIKNLSLAKNVANIGEVRTLIIHPDSTIYCRCSDTEKSMAGVNPQLIRVSVGIEDLSDIVEDFEKALQSL